MPSQLIILRFNHVLLVLLSLCSTLESTLCTIWLLEGAIQIKFDWLIDWDRTQKPGAPLSVGVTPTVSTCRQKKFRICLYLANLGATDIQNNCYQSSRCMFLVKVAGKSQRKDIPHKPTTPHPPLEGLFRKLSNQSRMTMFTQKVSASRVRSTGGLPSAATERCTHTHKDVTWQNCGYKLITLQERSLEINMNAHTMTAEPLSA